MEDQKLSEVNGNMINGYSRPKAKIPFAGYTEVMDDFKTIYALLTKYYGDEATWSQDMKTFLDGLKYRAALPRLEEDTKGVEIPYAD